MTLWAGNVDPSTMRVTSVRSPDLWRQSRFPFLNRSFHYRAERHDLKSWFLLFILPIFLEEKRKGEKNNQSPDFKSCLLLDGTERYYFWSRFCFFILLFSSLLKKEGREKRNEVAKIVIKSHTFLFHPSARSSLRNKIYTVIFAWKKSSIILQGDTG